MKSKELPIAYLSSEKEDYDIAETIIQQIITVDWTALGIIGASLKKRLPVKSGVTLRKVIVSHNPESGRNRWGNIQITLNPMDTYDMIGWTTDSLGLPKDVVFKHEGVYFDQLAGLIHQIIFPH